MNRIIKVLRSPGARHDIVGVAPTQHVRLKTACSNGSIVAVEPNVAGYSARIKPRLLDRWLDRVVQFSGSPYVFVFTVLCLLVWALLGIPFHREMDWQVLISDVQAIVSYVFDSFLMRQLLNEHEQSMQAVAEIRSRTLSHERMLKALLDPNRCKFSAAAVDVEAEVSTATDSQDLPADNWFGRLSTWLAHVLGHMATVLLFWTGIVIWLGFGQYSGWTNMWQLYINSATSALMVFVFSFLANINERHSQYTRQSLDVIYRVDAALELRLRQLTGDALSNQPVVIAAAGPVGPVQRAIYYYADVVGTLVGIMLLLIVVVVWVVIGPAMAFSSNWWMLIGTYAGLTGMNDGFVLRNVQAKLRAHEDQQFVLVDLEDAALLCLWDQDMPEMPEKQPLQSEQSEQPAQPEQPEQPEQLQPTYLVQKQREQLSQRMSRAVGRVCAHELMVVSGVLVIAGLVTAASVLRWSTTGQLLCNVPPSIIESFFMIILITGHNMGDAQKRADLLRIYRRRLRLLSLVEGAAVRDGLP